jgi:hypothetical protein
MPERIIVTQPFPFSLWLLMIIGVIGYGLYTRKVSVCVNESFSYTRTLPAPALFWITTLIIAWFAGNVFANDVYIYRLSYVNQPQGFTWSTLFALGLGDNPSYKMFRWLSLKYITRDPAIFQLLWVGTAQILFITTYRRYSASMSLTIFMVIASGLFYFTSVSWKQSMAMSIGFAITPLALSRKWIPYYVILLATSTIHPYILLYGVFPFFVSPRLWTKKSVILLVAMLGVGMMLSVVVGTALEITQQVFGDDHEALWFSEDHGIKPERVVFYAICPVLALIYRKRLKELANPAMNAMIQMSVISFGFMAMSMSGGANFISRMGNYFEPFTYVALPYILMEIVPKKSRTAILYGVITLYLIFFTFLQLKHGSIW